MSTTTTTRLHAVPRNEWEATSQLADGADSRFSHHGAHRRGHAVGYKAGYAAGVRWGRLSAFCWGLSVGAALVGGAIKLGWMVGGGS